jgi:PKD repeat protein
VRQIRHSIQLIAFVLCSLLAAAASTKFQATTTLSAETGSNTSAAGSFVSQTNGNVGGANISKVSTRNLLYANAGTKIFAHFMPWFGFSNHMNVGYNSNDALQVQKQVADMVSRGLDGTIIDWYGRGQSNKQFLAYDQTTQLIMHQAELQPAFSFLVMYDTGALKTCAATVGCDVTQAMIDDLNYVNVTYAPSRAYVHVGTQPVIFFFGDDAYAIDWTRVRAGVAGNPLLVFRNAGAYTHTQAGGGYSWLAPETVSTTDPMALLYMDNFYRTAQTHASMFSMGSGYKGFNDSLAAWGTGRLINQQCGQTWLKSMAEAGKYYSSTLPLAFLQVVTWNDYEEGTEIETGIDNCVTVNAAVTGTVASWSITGQANTVDHYSIYLSQDGQNLMWLADSASAGAMDLAAFGFNSGNYQVFVKATGKPSMTNKMSAGVQVTIPNKPPVAVLSVTPLTGTAPLNVTASAAASSDIDGSIVSTAINFGDGSAVVNAISASHTYATAGTFTVTATVTDNLGATASQSAVVTVIAANKPPVAVLSVTPSNGYAPVTVTASTSASTDPDGTIASSVINWGDGTSTAGPTASHIYATAGTYTITAIVTDNLGASASATLNVTALSPQVVVKSPVASVTGAALSVPLLNSPLHLVASGFSGFAVTAMQIYVDGKLVNTFATPAIDTSVAAAPGLHAFVIKGWDSGGRSFSSGFNVTVNAPPTAALGLNSASVLVGGSVTASAAASTDADGSIVSTSINFGDGAVASGASATHQYTVAGTYTVTATVTDNTGASSSKSQSVTVNPQFTTITSPTVTGTTSSQVTVAGTASSGYAITATQIYVDGVLKAQTRTASANTVVTLAVGTHLLTVQGWDASGATFRSAMTFSKK